MDSDCELSSQFAMRIRYGYIADVVADVFSLILFFLIMQYLFFIIFFIFD
jgi:hypothetical protein